MTERKTRNMIYAALFAALITVLTAYFHINTGTNSGYIHFGDSMIYIAACVLPFPYAVATASIGGALADLLSGAPVWSVATLIIKALNVIPFVLMFKISKKWNKSGRIISPASVIAAALSGIITSVGYFIAETILFNFRAAVVSFWPGLIQPAGSILLFYIAGMALDSIKFKSKLTG